MENTTMPQEASQMTAPKIFFGFALADGMFAGDQTIVRREITVDQVREIVAGVESCLNPSHVATIGAMRSRYGLDVAIPATPPRVVLRPGDAMIVMGVRGLPRLTDRHEYSEEEIAQATFAFAKYTVARKIVLKCPMCGHLTEASSSRFESGGWIECSWDPCCLDIGKGQEVSGA